MSNLDDDTLPPDDDLNEDADEDADEPLAINEVENNLATPSSSESGPRKRGPNKRKWAIDGNPQPMEFDSDGSAVGAKFKDLNSYIAEVGRDLKLDIDDFRLMPDEELTWAWERIKDRIAWTEEQDTVLQTKVMKKCYQKASVAWKQKKGNLRKYYYNDNKNDPSRWIPPDVNIGQEQWKHLVMHWDDPHYKEKQTVNQQNRSQQEFQHCTGSKPHAVIANEYLCKHGKLPDMVTLYLLCHTKGQDEKSWIDEGSKQKWGQIQTTLSEMPLEIQNTTEGRNAAWEKVFANSTIGCGVSAVDKPARKRGKSAIDMAIAKIYVELQAQFEAKLNANQKLVEERIEEERRKFEMARKDWEAQQVIQQQKWMDEGVRRWENELRQFRPSELDTPAWMHEDSIYNESYNPLAQPRRLNNGGRLYAPQREFRYNSCNTSNHISQPTLGDNHGWRQPRAHLPGNMSSIGFASTLSPQPSTPSPQQSVAPVDADFTSSISSSHNDFFDAQTSYRPCMDLVNQARRGKLSSTRDATSNQN